MQLGILIENMRREGFELTVSRPVVFYPTATSGEKLEPIEEVIIDVDEAHTGVVVQKLPSAKASCSKCVLPAAADAPGVLACQRAG